jgi:hypothetical protein
MIVQMNSGQLFKIDQNHCSLFYDGRNTFKNGYAKMSVTNDEDPYLAVGSLNGSIFIFDQNGLIKNEFQIEFNRNNKILQILWLNNTFSSKLLVCIPDGIMVNERFLFLRAIRHLFSGEKKKGYPLFSFTNYFPPFFSRQPLWNT